MRRGKRPDAAKSAELQKKLQIAVAHSREQLGR